MHCQNKINLILAEMTRAGIDAYIVPASDPHASEYLPDYYKTRQWASGFTGSAGTLVITPDLTGLWTDGRYYVQAEKELAGSGITLFKDGTPGTPSLAKWLSETLKPGSTIGFNGYQMMAKEVQTIKELVKDQSIQFDYQSNLIDKIWLDRPYLPSEKIEQHPEFFSGESCLSKISRIRESMQEQGACCHLISKLDDIAWILNLRGRDIPNNPFFLSYLFVKPETTLLYVDSLKLNDDILHDLHENNVRVKLYEDLDDDLKQHTCEKGLLMDLSCTPYHFYHTLKNKFRLIEATNPSTYFKSLKNDTEISHLKRCYSDDGLAMIRFLCWLDASDKNGLTELSVSEKLSTYRDALPLYKGQSFDAIVAYKDHGAIMHYRATSENTYTLEAKGLLLVDSGGQYSNGTTDITRTVALGPLTEEERRDYTLTLKSMLALSRARFLEGTTGTHLDPLARSVMWSHHLDYKSGTGHGIGFYLGVHEGPQKIALLPSSAPLRPGMVVTNEPGVYRKGKHGIRIENTLVVVEDVKNDFGTFYKFENITLCPYDIDAIDTSMLSYDEIDEINAYHQTIFTTFAPQISESERQWLERVTKAI